MSEYGDDPKIEKCFLCYGDILVSSHLHEEYTEFRCNNGSCGITVKVPSHTDVLDAMVALNKWNRVSRAVRSHDEMLTLANAVYAFRKSYDAAAWKDAYPRLVGLAAAAITMVKGGRQND